jgi:hypothetical protein
LRIQGCVQFYFRGLTRRPPLEKIWERIVYTYMPRTLTIGAHVASPTNSIPIESLTIKDEQSSEYNSPLS